MSLKTLKNNLSDVHSSEVVKIDTVMWFQSIPRDHRYQLFGKIFSKGELWHGKQAWLNLEIR